MSLLISSISTVTNALTARSAAVIAIALMTLLSAQLTAAGGDPFGLAGGALCNDTLGCNLHGSCEELTYNGTTAKRCVCYTGYILADCSYAQFDSARTGGLQIGISFLCIFGVGNFIVGNTSRAAGQLVLGLIMWITLCPAIMIGVCCGAFSKEGKRVMVFGGVYGCIVCVCVLSGFVWSLVDGVNMLHGNYLDANGYPLA